MSVLTSHSVVFTETPQRQVCFAHQVRASTSEKGQTICVFLYFGAGSQSLSCSLYQKAKKGRKGAYYTTPFPHLTSSSSSHRSEDHCR